MSLRASVTSFTVFTVFIVFGSLVVTAFTATALHASAIVSIMITIDSF